MRTVECVKTVNVHEAKTHLSRLLAEVEAGEEVVICRAGKPIARLSAEPLPAKRITLGRDAGKFVVGPEFFEPPRDEIAVALGGREPGAPRRFGRDEGAFVIPADFDAPLFLTPGDRTPSGDH